ncbi:pentatricopeptide repeat-containing protein At1g11900 isoform X2 [Humulus lupulus]|uniref:pentatricopeptide repeat-containing protein At1g11900 isoform X2 n=1 Tax=Humulus lupulus TaxID=3486 RepID=UPI002B4076CD|nr:pentatricopeptide repeat-containing protein At1g11900 isoform X2 [Humulus lupulus]
MLFPSRSFRRILMSTKAAQFTSRTHCCHSVSIRFFQDSIPLNPTRRNQLSIISIPVVCFWSSPVFVVASRLIGSCQSFSTKASHNEEEELVLNEIFAAIETAPRSASELCTAYIDKLCKSGNISAAARFLKSLHDKHTFISSRSYNVLLAAACEKNDTALISQVFSDAIGSSKTFPPTSYLYIAEAFAKTNECTDLLRFIKDILELTLPSMNVLNSIILAFAECRKSDQALLIYDQIKSSKYKPDLITYNIVLHILGCAGHIDKMLHEFSSMKEAGIVPDVISYNTLLNSLKKAGRVDMCAVFFKEMVDNRIQPDLLTYTALIDCIGRAGNVEESLRLFSEMKGRQIRPSIYIYRSLVHNLNRMGKLELAKSVLEEMKSCSPSDLASPGDFKPYIRGIGQTKSKFF